ncbi:leukocyte elastase inhibitor-like isoform X1 [Carassius auratus]|uniref:Serpin B6 n=1 Tax=Carassius auratus TaxID=7957 RepID=A0A6P6R259_CARAU|nr:leukocyte elastase inhibitor-like isoform X1 [Carassius auratus]
MKTLNLRLRQYMVYLCFSYHLQLVKMEQLSAANTQFCLNLFKKISEGDASGNVFYSPISISSALAMVSLGAKENTAEQMFKVLSFTNPPKPDAVTPASHQQAQHGQHGPSITQQTQTFEKCPPQPDAGQKTEDQIHSSFNKLMSELKRPGAPSVLSLANRLYGEQSYQFVEKFLNDAKRYYEAGLEEVDFKKKPDATRVDINKWVEKNTQGKIKDLLPQGSIDAMTRLVLVNAIYFKGNWMEKFPKKATRDGQFKLNKTQTKPVKMMQQKAEFPLAFIPEMDSQVLELSYVGKNLSMLIILPNEIQGETTGLQKLEKALSYEKLMEWTRPEVMYETEVEVSLPRFKMEETYDMKSLLISMGMEDVFDGKKVNLSGMSPNNDLVVSKVIHKAFVEVNEEGTEAAGATGVGMTKNCLIIPKVFNADHPFLFFIRHNPTKSILFYGRFCSP